MIASLFGSMPGGVQTRPRRRWFCAGVFVGAWLGLLLPAAAVAAGAIDPASLISLQGRIEPRDGGQAEIVVAVEVAAAFHINAHQPDDPFLIPTTLSLSAAKVSFNKPVYPKPKREKFAFAPDKGLLVLSGAFEIRARATPAPSGAVEASLHYQACDATRCLAPATVRLRFPSGKAAVSAFMPADPTDDGGLLARFLDESSLPVALGMILLLGLGLNLTPCVYPLISVTLGYFGAQAGHGHRPWSLAVAYVLGLTLSFALLGTAAALLGSLVGAPLQQPVVVLSLAGVLLALALSSFGVFEIRLPHALVNRLGVASRGFGGAGAMGLTMGVVAAPCIGPVVLGLVLYVGARQDAALGFLLFSVLGLGMGAPYILLAGFAGSLHRLPRAGEWLRWMNHLFGFLLLGMALFFVRHLLPEAVLHWLVPVLIGVAAMYLGFFESSGQTMRGFTTFRRFGGLLALLLAAWLAIPAAPAAKAVLWEPLSLSAVDRVMGQGRPAVVEFSADWCAPCVEMQRSTFVDPAVVAESREVAMLQVDVTASDAAADALLQRFEIAGVPTMLFFDATGREIERLVGFVETSRMLELLRRIRRETDETAGA